MRIAFIAQNFYPEQVSNNAIAQDLVNRGHELDIITQVPNYGQTTFFDGYSNSKKRSETWVGVQIHRAWTIARGNSKLRLAGNYLCFPISASWAIWRHLKRPADVSFVSLTSPVFQAFAGIFLKWTRKVPTVFWVQDIWPESFLLTLNLRNPLVVKPLMWICGWLYRRADLVLVQSPSFTDMICRFGISKDRIRYLPNTAPPYFKPVAKRAAESEGALIKQGRFNLMFAGNIGESQDFDTLILAAEKLRERTELNWVIIGSGRDVERVKRIISEKKLTDQFQFLGRHSEESMPNFFSHADAMLVSLKDTEIFSLTIPYKIQCYMACGKPIIASLSGVGRSIVEEAGAGLGVDANNPDELAAIIKKMMDLSDAQRTVYGKNALTYFQKHFSQGKVYSDLEAWLVEVSEGRVAHK